MSTKIKKVVYRIKTMVMRDDEKLTDMLLDDEKFIQWVFRPSIETDAYWYEYMMRNPDKMDDIRLVKEIVKNLHASTKRLSDSEKAGHMDES
jgi:hypothetical protein